MTPRLSRSEIDKLIRARMAEGPFTLQDLQRLLAGCGPKVGVVLTEDQMLVWARADALIQRRRKAGEIVSERQGRSFVWREVK